MKRTYVITGSASGIGAATAQLLRERGNTVIGVDLRDAEVHADLSTPSGRSTAAAEAVRLSGGQIDAVIACAGISAPQPITVSVNYFGVTEFLTHLNPVLSRSRTPRAVVVSSMAALQPNSAKLVDALLADDEPRAIELGQQLADEGPDTGYLNYSSSKRALSRWVRRECIKEEWAGAGIPLNAVAPGTVLSAMTLELLASPESRAMVDAAVPMPLNYHAQPLEMARLLAWLASEENTHTTGQTIYADGGADASLRGDDIWK